ncbi:MauE/DoxX family redox-associated membrane protein, partial [Dactylosporangium fulvum]
MARDGDDRVGYVALCLHIFIAGVFVISAGAKVWGREAFAGFVAAVHDLGGVPVRFRVVVAVGTIGLEILAAGLQLAPTALRKALAEAGCASPADVLVTRAPGYLLRGPALRTDLDGFDRLVSDAAARAPRDPAGAVRLLTAALALWRGPA